MRRLPARRIVRRSSVKRKTMAPRRTHRYPKTTFNKSGVLNRRTGGLTDQEVKFHDLNLGPSMFVPTNGVLLFESVNNVPQGQGATQRLGRKLKLRYLTVKGSVRIDTTFDIPGASLPRTGTRVRLLVVLEKQNNSTVPTILRLSEILQDIGGFPSINSFYNLENQKRYRILADKIYLLDSKASFNSIDPANGFQSADFHSVNFQAVLDVDIDFDSTTSTGDVGTMPSNNIMVFAIADVANQARIFLVSRARFTG